MRGFIASEAPRRGQLSPWAQYLRAALERPGWKMARLTKALAEMGKPISRTTLYRMMSDEITHVSTRWVVAIAEAFGDDPQAALRLAGLETDGEQGDPRLRALGLDPDDPTVQRILNGPFDFDLQTMMLKNVSSKRAELYELQLRQEAAEVEQYEQFWNARQGRAQPAPRKRGPAVRGKPHNSGAA